jgi:hypothetical protein
MGLTATITGDCRHLSITAAVQTGQATLTITNNGVSWSTATVIPGTPTWNTVLDLTATIGIIDGIFEVRLTDASGQTHLAAVLGDCSLQCCISKKLDSILGCDCSCSKCNHHLITAERVQLLITGIRFALSRIGDNINENTAILENSKKKYNKATELCSDSCGCNC